MKVKVSTQLGECEVDCTTEEFREIFAADTKHSRKSVVFVGEAPPLRAKAVKKKRKVTGSGKHINWKNTRVGSRLTPALSEFIKAKHGKSAKELKLTQKERREGTIEFLHKHKMKATKKAVRVVEGRWNWLQYERPQVGTQ